MNSLTLFLALQVGDFLTTLFFLHIGVQEGNPLIRFLMREFSPLMSLVLVKGLGFALGIIVFFRGWNFKKLNGAYILLIVWNLTAIIVQLSK